MSRRCLLILLLLPLRVQAQTFSQFIGQLWGTPDSLRQARVDSFLNAYDQMPYLENDTLAHFIWAGDAGSVTVAGDFTNWDPDVLNMQTVAATDFWYRSHRFESDARLDYKFVLNGTNWILDPRNPHTIMGGYGPNSELRMPAWESPPEIAYYPDIPHGTLRDTTYYSQFLGNSRLVRTWLPPDFPGEGLSYPLLLVHDGTDYINLAQMDRVLDYLLNQDRIVPLIAVFVPPVNRTEEYAGSLQDEFTDFITEELLPDLESRLPITEDPHRHCVMGASNGGNISLHLGTAHPELFGQVFAQSSNVQDHIADLLNQDPPLPLNFTLDIGTYDIPYLIERVDELLVILNNHDYPYRFDRYHEGHSWGNWRAHIRVGLLRFFASEENTGRSSLQLPDSHHLLHNAPNPFNGETTLNMVLPATAKVDLTLYNIQGQRLEQLFSGVLPAGKHTLTRDLGQYPSGTYLLQLSTPASRESMGITLLK